MVTLACRARSPRARGGVRALLGRAPTAAEVAARVARLGGRVLGVAADEAPAAAPQARVFRYALAPGAAPVEVAVLADGDLEVAAPTSALGPGYHQDVAARLGRLVDELDLAWAPPAPGEGGGGPALGPGAPRAAVEAAHLAWLARRLAAGQAAGRTWTRIGLGDAPRFHVPAPVLTALGPRDAAWRAAVLAEPARGADAFPWWEDGPGAAARARALRAMWLEVAWRAPLDDDERALLARVDADLRQARREAPGAPLPWPAWRELHALLGLDDALTAELAGRAGDDAPPIGYRRWPMTAPLTGGWSVRVPGDMVTGLDDDGARVWATNGRQALDFVAMDATGRGAPAALLAAAPERHPVCARRADAVHGRVERQADGDQLAFHGLVAVEGAVGILTATWDGAPAAEVEAWAIEAWRSLRWRPAREAADGDGAEAAAAEGGPGDDAPPAP